jgi:hypothetical protein
MKKQHMFVAATCSVAVLSISGCAAPSTSNTKKNRDEVALMKEEAQRFEKRDGSLSPDYVADLVLNGSGKKSSKPVFDQPRGDDKTQ